MRDNEAAPLSWAPSTAATLTPAVLGVAVLAYTFLAQPDARRTVLFTIAGLGMLIVAAHSWYFRPRLALTPAGLTMRGMWRAPVLTPDTATQLRVIEFRRYGRTWRQLEIDTSDNRLLIFTRWGLGTDPYEVLAALNAAGYTGR